MAEGMDTEEIKSLIGVSRKRALNFGLCLGKKPDTTVIIMHRMKSPDVLGRQAKQAGETNKTTYGTLETKGKKLNLMLDADMPPGLALQGRKFFSSIGIKLSIVVMDATGNMLDSDLDDDDTGDDQDQDTNEADPNAEKWAAAKVKFEPRVLKAMSADEGDSSKLRTMWNYAVNAADEGDYVTALKVLAKIAPLLSAGGAKPDAGPEGSDDPSKKMFAQSRVQWVNTRKKMGAEMAKLEAEIIKQEAEDEDNEPEDVAHINETVGTIHTYLERFDGRLENALLAVIDAPDDTTRTQNIVACRIILDDFSKHLEDPFFQVIDSDNGYANVAIASTAQKSIEAIQKWLK